MNAPTVAWLCVSPGGAKDAAASLEGMRTYENFGRDCRALVFRADYDTLRAQLEAAEARAEAAEAECARLREDAERFRFIAAQPTDEWVSDSGDSFRTLSEAVDASMAARTKEKQA